MFEFGSYWNLVAAFFSIDTARLLEPDMLARLTLQALLFACSAFFSGSETALFSLSRLDLQKLRRERHPKSETLHALLDVRSSRWRHYSTTSPSPSASTPSSASR